jgi:heat shock protein HslJ
MRRLFILLGTIGFLCCSAGSKQDGKSVLWVNSSMGPCVGRAPTKCLQVQKADTLDPQAWKSFHSPIEGFEFQEGYFYKIVVQEHHQDTMGLGAEASSIEYTLVEILEKRQDLRFRINGAWELRQMNAEFSGEGAGASQAPRLEIHIGDMRYMGNDGCNRFSGGLIQVDEYSIRFGIAAGTRMMCPEMHIPDKFNATLPEVRLWKIQQDTLHFSDQNGKDLMQLVRTE